MKENIFMESDCLTSEQILNYKSNSLSDGELRKIESHLIDCPLCSDAVEGAEKIIFDDLKRDTNFIKNKFQNSTKKISTKVYLYSAVAALLLITATVIFNISRPSNAEVLFNKYFEVYPDVTVHKRGLEVSSKFVDAMNLYNKKEFQKALKLFNEIGKISNNETAIFYKGVTLMALDKMDNALDEFLKICNNDKNSFYYESNWYAALSLIYLGREDKSKDYLLRLSNSSDYKEKAREILNQINKSE